MDTNKNKNVNSNNNGNSNGSGSGSGSKTRQVIIPPPPNHPIFNKIKNSNPETYKKIGIYLYQLSEKTVNAVTVFKAPETPFHGRTHELELLQKIMYRPLTPVAILLGEPGVGKTAMILEYTRQHPNTVTINLNIGTLSAIGADKMRLALTSLLKDLHHLQTIIQTVEPDSEVILFIDEIHTVVTIFGAGTKIGGDILKETFNQPPIKIITATTRREYDSTIAVDKPLAERFKQIELQDLTTDQVKSIARERWGSFTSQPLGEDVLNLVIHANHAYRSDSAEPRKTIDILEDLAAYAQTTQTPPTTSTVEQIFKDRYRINLHFNVNPDDVYNTIASRVKGQPAALHVLKRLIRGLTYRIDPKSNKPLTSALLTGPTGVGKTETVKSIADTIYPGENVIRFLNMTDFQTAEREPLFRKQLGEHVKHTPNAIVLFDELEKSHESVRDSLLQILDEGIVTYETITRENLVETNHTSLRNTMIFATTNAGHEVFKSDAQYSLREEDDDINDLVDTAGIDQLLKGLYPFLESAGFRPEMLGRFNRVLPYRGLTSGTLLRITEIKLQAILDQFARVHGKFVRLRAPRNWSSAGFDYVSTDVAVFITFMKAKANDPNSGGARAIQRHLESLVYDVVIDALIDFPDATNFDIFVSEDSAIYRPGALNNQGGVVVRPVARR